MIVLPLTPFVHRAPNSLFAFLALVFVATTAYNLIAFPFSSAEPFKVFFKQTLDLDTGSNTVYLEGIQPFLTKGVVPELPSASGAAVNCSSMSIRVDLYSCQWPGLSPNVVPGVNISSSLSLIKSKPKSSLELLTYSANRTAERVTFSIKARDTRNCRIFFDDPIQAIHVHGSKGRLQVGKTDGKMTQVKLWSRTWEREFKVDVWFADQGDGKKGRVACEWSEMLDGRVPALEEVITFLPMWSAVTKADDGLVEGYKAFEV